MKKWGPFLNNLVDHTQQERLANLIYWVKYYGKFNIFPKWLVKCACNAKRILYTCLVMCNLFYPCWKIKYRLFKTSWIFPSNVKIVRFWKIWPRVPRKGYLFATRWNHFVNFDFHLNSWNQSFKINMTVRQPYRWARGLFKWP